MSVHEESRKAVAAAERPLRADAERNRRRILAAAGEVFAVRGLDAGLDEIARHAGVGIGTIYRRFPDKRVLIDALFDDRIGGLIELAERAAAEEDAWQGLVDFLTAAVQMQVADRGLNELLFGAVEGTARAELGRHRLVPLAISLIGRAQQQGTLRPDLQPADVAMVQIMLTAAGHFSSPVAPDQWRRLLTILLDGLQTRRDGPTPLPTGPLTQEQFDSACGRGSAACHSPPRHGTQNPYNSAQLR